VVVCETRHKARAFPRLPGLLGDGGSLERKGEGGREAGRRARALVRWASSGRRPLVAAGVRQEGARIKGNFIQ
jgi:hypothetical protein